MIPKKAKALIAEVAKELQLSEREVSSVLDVYWEGVRKNLSSLEHNKVFVKGLGTFYIKPWALKKRIMANKARIDASIENPTARSLGVLNELYKENLKLEAVKAKEDAEVERKLKIRHERHNQDLEGEEQDS